MTIPNVSMSWCNRKAQCNFCPDHIGAGEPLVTVFFWNKGTPDHKGFNTKQYYHPQCWVAQGLDYLSLNPYVPYQKQKRLDLVPEQKERRNILLRRKCSLEQRRRNLKAEYPERLLLEARIESKIVGLMLEIAPLGGIPKKWLEPQEV